MDLRRPFIEELERIAKKDERIVFITCDVGFSFLDPLKEILGPRFLNLGITEPHSVADAVGMSLEGMKPYVYSMIPFVLFRPFEVVRSLVACGQTDVKLLGVSGSAAYAMLGYSHNCLWEGEDIDRLKGLAIQPHVPKDEEEARRIARETYLSNFPTYVRL